DQLPADNERVVPAKAVSFARIVSPNTASAMRTAPGAHHWRLLCLEFLNNKNGFGDILEIGDGSSAQSSLSQVPFQIVVDRVYLHGDPLYGQKRGIALNGADVTIRNSYISDIKAVGQDSQGIGGWNGPGPFTIENNYVEAAAENFLLGGSDPAIPGLVSQHVTVRYNYMSRPMAWRDPIIQSPTNVSAVPANGALPPGTYSYVVVAGRSVGQGTMGHSLPSVQVNVSLASSGGVLLSWTPVQDATEYYVYGRTAGGLNQYWKVMGTSFADTGVSVPVSGTPPTSGTIWQVKNIFELKNARDVLVENYVFENNWKEAQPGYAIVFTPRNQDGSCTWCTIEGVVFRHNIVRNVAAGFNISGRDYPNVSQQTNGVTISDNLVYGIQQSLGGNGWGILVGDGPANLVVTHNTFDFDGTTLLYVYGGSATSPTVVNGFLFTYNAAPNGTYGLNGASASPGALTIQMYFPGSTVTGNWLSGAPASKYPPGNRTESPFDSYVADRANANYLLIGALAQNGADGLPVGADIAGLSAVQPVAIGQSGAPTIKPPANVRIISSGG
ncbi:MAG TPA: hypothetical protein VNR64_00275, partial [Vicinamibacterales bacterium]|nr:hypothetical protein [Vicinamibacterales bacterium]